MLTIEPPPAALSIGTARRAQRNWPVRPDVDAAPPVGRRDLVDAAGRPGDAGSKAERSIRSPRPKSPILSVPSPGTKTNTSPRAPPSSRSLPGPPAIRSGPPPPKSLSEPSLPKSVSSPLLPMTMSSETRRGHRPRRRDRRFDRGRRRPSARRRRPCRAALRGQGRDQAPRRGRTRHAPRRRDISRSGPVSGHSRRTRRTPAGGVRLDDLGNGGLVGPEPVVLVATAAEVGVLDRDADYRLVQCCYSARVGLRLAAGVVDQVVEEEGRVLLNQDELGIDGLARADRAAMKSIIRAAASDPFNGSPGRRSFPRTSCAQK